MESDAYGFALPLELAPSVAEGRLLAMEGCGPPVEHFHWLLGQMVRRSAQSTRETVLAMNSALLESHHLTASPEPRLHRQLKVKLACADHSQTPFG